MNHILSPLCYALGYLTGVAAFHGMARRRGIATSGGMALMGAGLIGGLGAAPGANIGVGAAIFEAVHGSAPDIAGQGVANPLAVLLAAGLMLEHAGRGDLAGRLRSALDRTLNEDGVRTRDLGGSAGTGEFARAVARRAAEED